MKKPPLFTVGDTVLFLGGNKSLYGKNYSAKRYSGQIVTITDIHHNAYPYAYIFKEFGQPYWFSENCFERIAPVDLPEFEASGNIEAILF